MTTYQVMTFGTDDSPGSIEQVSQQEFYDSFGDPWSDSGWESLPEEDYGSAWQPSEYYDPSPQQYVSVPARLSGPVGVPSAPSKIFDAKNSSYDIVPGKQQGALNDPRTVQGADGYYYQVTRIGTDKYDIKPIGEGQAVVGSGDTPLVFSPVKDVQVVVQQNKGGSIPVQIIRSDDNRSETFVLSDDMTEDDVRQAYDNILSIVSRGSGGSGALPASDQNKELFVQSVMSSPRAPSGTSSTSKPAVLFPPKAPSTPADPSGGDEKSSSDESIVEPEEENNPWIPDFIENLFPSKESKDPVLPDDDAEEEKEEESAIEKAIDIAPKRLTAPFSRLDDALSPTVESSTPTFTGSYDSDSIPRTDEEKQAATLAWLKTKQDYYRLTDKEVENLAKYFSPMLPAMTQNDVDLRVVAKHAQLYEDLFNGDRDAFESFDNPLINSVDTSGDFTGWNSLNERERQWILKEWNQQMIDDGIPAISQAYFNAGIYDKLKKDYHTEDTAEWMRKGGILDAINNDTLWQASSGAKEFLHSKNGMAAVGLTFQGIAVIGSFMSAGPIGAMAVAGTTPFSATEGWQTWGDNPFVSKANLQLDANYAWDFSSQHDQLFNVAKGAVDDLGFKANSNDPEVNKLLMQRSDEALEALAKSLRDNYVMLQATGTYDSEVEKYDLLRARSLSGKDQFTEQGEFDKKKYQPSYADLRNIPSGYHVEWNGETRPSGNKKIRAGDGTTESVVIAINDKTGERIPLGTVKVQPFGQDTIYDVGSAIEKALSYKKGDSDSVTTGKTTVYVPPGIKFEYLGKTYTGGENGISYDIKRQDGAPLRLTFESIDGSKKPLTEYIGFPETGWNQYSVPSDLKGATVGSQQGSTVEGFQTYLSPGQRLYWKDLDITGYIDPETGKVAMPGPGTYYLSIVNPDGTKTSKNVYVGAGTFNTLDLGDTSYKPAAKTSHSSGGGGGGGGGGGSATYKPAATARRAAPSSMAMIIYGETCRDARIWQDDVEVAPEIGKSYSISPGYHSVKIEKDAKKPWLKTVYCVANDTITVSPAFEDLDVVNPPADEEPSGEEQLKRVFVNSNPSGAKVLINGAASGQWTPCFFDLPEGYYLFTIQKSGYDAYDIKCYVGEVIAWNEQASALAASRGWL